MKAATSRIRFAIARRTSLSASLRNHTKGFAPSRRFIFVGLLSKALSVVDKSATDKQVDRQTDKASVAQKLSTDIAPVSFSVTANPGVEYVVFDVLKRPDGLIEVFSRRKGSSGTSFARRLVDCQNWKFMYLAEGDTVAELSVLHPDARMAQLTAGSSSTAVSYNGCKLAGMTD